MWLVPGDWFFVLGSFEGIGSKAPSTKKQNGTGDKFNLCRTCSFHQTSSKLVVVIDVNIQDLVI